MKRMIFHFPAPFNAEKSSGSQLRPIRMYQAFKAIGYQVDLVVGHGAARRQAIQIIRDHIMNGVVYDFLYSESLTLPIALSEPHHFPLYPLLELNFFRFCRKQGIPISIFYRDIQWRFKSITAGVSCWKRWIARPFYYWDLWVYQHFANLCYLPHTMMQPYLPQYVRPANIAALPPGADVAVNITSVPSQSLRLLYVGGLVGQYRLHALFDAVSQLADQPIELNICCREKEWQQQRHQYQPYLTDNIHIHHLSGEAVSMLYAQADIGCFVVAPDPYMRFAMPVKLFEYLGYDKPIIATKGLASADFVVEQGVGWSVEYTVDALKTLFCHLLHSPAEVVSITEHCRMVKSQQTWQARAHKVAADMKALKT